jgi:hypothetical protein
MDANDAIKKSHISLLHLTPHQTLQLVKTHNLCGSVVLQTSWPPRVLCSRVILGGGLSREKCVLLDGKMRCMIQMLSAVHRGLSHDRCTVCRENFIREMGVGRRRLGEAPFGYKEIQYFNDLISKQTFTRPP